MEDVIKTYQLQVAAAAVEVEKYRKLAEKYSLMRLGVFFLIALSVYWGIVADDFSIIAICVFLLIVSFMWLVSRQSGYEQKRKYHADLQRVTENELASIATQANIYNNGARYSNEKHFYISDLDIFGDASLFNLVNRAATSVGCDKLAAWLSSPSDRGEILLRQEAAADIGQKGTWKTEMQTLLLFANGTDAKRLQQLFTYLKSPLNIPGERLLSKYISIAPFLLAGAIAGAFFFPVFQLLAVLIAAGNLIIVSTKGSYIVKSSFIADKISGVLNGYAQALNKIETEQWQSQRISGIASRLKVNQTSAKIAALSALINKLSYSLVMIVGFVLNVFFLWALKQVIAIEQWKRENNQNLEEAFEMLAEMEALYSLAGLHINYPEWVVPEIVDREAYTIVANGLAHPLIPAAGRVKNNYSLDDTFKVDIITGSNMAGKSTFLRTIGINTVLALGGGPVCGDDMKVSVVTLISYMRIKDSLNESTSTFKAELNRLQMLLGAVPSDNKVFFLIDEMLRGTNSVDKYLGSKAVIEQLIAKHAVGMVATHDLQIAQLEQKYPQYVRNFYFDIQVINDEMIFDYQLKNGECKTFNASLLLKAIGIDVDNA